MANIVWWIYMTSTVSIYSQHVGYIYTRHCAYIPINALRCSPSAANKAVDNISPIAPSGVTTAICWTPSTNFPFRGETICRRSGESLPEVVRHSLWRSILLTFHPYPTGWLPKARTELFPIFINAFSIKNSFSMLLIVSKAYPLRKPDKLTVTPGCEK